MVTLLVMFSISVGCLSQNFCDDFFFSSWYLICWYLFDFFFHLLLICWGGYIATLQIMIMVSGRVTVNDYELILVKPHWMTATLALKNHLDLLIFTNRLCSPTINFFFIKKNWIGGISWLHNAEWHPNFAYLLWQEVPTMKYKSIDLYNWIRELAKYLFDLSSWCGIAAIKLVCDMKVEDWRSCLEPVTLTVSSIFTCCTFLGLYLHSW